MRISLTFPAGVVHLSSRVSIPVSYHGKEEEFASAKEKDAVFQFMILMMLILVSYHGKRDELWM